MGITNPDYMHIKAVVLLWQLILSRKKIKTIINISDLKTYLNCCEFLASLR